MASVNGKKLYLNFHGRIIDHLGIQMYQSPVAAIAELIANAWDADAEIVDIKLPPTSAGPQDEYIIVDDGIGMTFNECQELFLNVGYCRRMDNPGQKTRKGRPVLGRKGIGKFAGFGIANIIRIETISEETGEKTVFEMRLETLRDDIYRTDKDGGEVEVIEYLEPNEKRKVEHGTKVYLMDLSRRRHSGPNRFMESMARRFLLHEQVDDFMIVINDESLPASDKLVGTQWVFPRDYEPSEQPDGIKFDGDWGVETLTNGAQIKWRIAFLEDTIGEDDLRGISIFARGKLAQKPFFFNLSGGLGGQHGQQYITGTVQADYIDALEEELITTERQRINWDIEEAKPLEEWGQTRLKELLRLWKKRRGEKRQREIEERITGFSRRLDKLQPHEKRTVKQALQKLGSIAQLSDEQFMELSNALLLAWETGRLRGLIDNISKQENLSSGKFIELLSELEVVTALNLAEAARAKKEAIEGLYKLIKSGDLEVDLRDYIAERPWLLHPKWETYVKERMVTKILKDSAEEAKLSESTYKGRVDLALSSGNNLLVVEFMRPGLTVDTDHMDRCKRYIFEIRARIKRETGLGFTSVAGLVVAEMIANNPVIQEYVESLERDNILTYSWDTLLKQATKHWGEFLQILASRGPDDERLQAIADEDA